jgi:type I restriction enzyme, S subunit
MNIEMNSLGSTPDFEVRSSWPRTRLWVVASQRSVTGFPDLPLLSVFLGRGVILYGEGGGQVHKPSLDLTTYQVVEAGDLVLNNQQAWRGSVGVSKYHGIVSPAYVVFRLASSLNPRFADYLFQSRILVSQFVTASKGVGDIQRDIHMPWLKNVRLPVPPLDEQSEMVRFLDSFDGQLRRYIDVQRSLISQGGDRKPNISQGLIGEYRTRLIADVVTGRLDVRAAAARISKHEATSGDRPETDRDVADGGDTSEGDDTVVQAAEAGA